MHWGVPEGSYASEPDGPARVREFRGMVAALHARGLRVVLDVVYNHTFHSARDGAPPARHVCGLLARSSLLHCNAEHLCILCTSSTAYFSAHLHSNHCISHTSLCRPSLQDY